MALMAAVEEDGLGKTRYKRFLPVEAKEICVIRKVSCGGMMRLTI